MFFPLAVMGYYLTPVRYRWILLLLASYYFYMCWKAEYLIIIMFSTVVDYIAANMIARADRPAQKKAYLLLCLFVNLALLFTFKYFNFINVSVREVLAHLNVFYDAPTFRLLLPVGISFYTFQSIAYVVDVYRGVAPPEKHFGYYAVYVSFWPQLVAGPIERARHMMPQHHTPHPVNWARIVDGLYVMLWGFFKKLVVADRLSMYVNEVYNHPGEYHGLAIVIATYFFAFQIYCDFSGYSDIAIGAAQVLGYNLLDNFKRPYMGRNINDFWKRWHISLTSWFRDYLYIPLGGNRVSPRRRQVNVFLVFLISGLWHGANWTFMIWGALHGLYYLISTWTQSLRQRTAVLFGMDKTPRLHAVFQVLVTFHIVLFAWVFFRAASFHDAITLIAGAFQSGAGHGLIVGMLPVDFYVGLLAVVFMMLIEATRYNPEENGIRCILGHRSPALRHSFYYATIVLILVFGKFGSSPFIYFQF